MKKVGIQAPKGTGFYTLRRTAATIAARSGDPFAVQRLLGHVDLTMATRYVQDDAITANSLQEGKFESDHPYCSGEQEFNRLS
jgi:integrase